eukprot:TRINITY_DN32177_c0_g1_i2.p1 TRINITY_DN32177_c0_g1~~TRINITY_DN32177_c0_g1_i2.p1  ORF type:complete len:438 (+),score=156.45 TRINITY_DN32177_c0_g1_i2:59-1372(+)
MKGQAPASGKRVTRVVKRVVKRRAPAASAAAAPAAPQAAKATAKAKPASPSQDAARKSPPALKSGLKKPAKPESPKAAPQAAASPTLTSTGQAVKSILKKKPSTTTQSVGIRLPKKKQKAPKEPQQEAPKDTIFIVAGTYDGSVAGYKFSPTRKTLTPSFAVKPHQGYVSASAQSDRWILSGGSDESIALFNGKRMTEVGSCGSEGTPTVMMIMGDSSVLCATSTGMLHVYQTHDWMTIWKEQGHRRRINDLALHPNQALGLTVGDDEFMKLWDFAKCKLILQVKLPKSASMVRCLPCGGGYFLVAGPTVTLFDMEGGEKATLKLPNTASNEVADPHCCVLLGGPAFLFGMEDGTLVAVAVTTTSLEVLWTMQGHPSRVKAMDVCEHDGQKHIVSVCSSGNLVVWENNGLQKPTELKRINQHARFTSVTAMWRSLQK